MLTKTPVSFHVFWKEERLLQSLGYMTYMPPVVMSNGGIPGNGDTIHFQFGRPYARWTAHLSHGRIFPAFNRVGSPTSLVLRLPLLFVSLWRAYLALLRILWLSLSPRARIGFYPKISRKLRRRRRRVHWRFGLVDVLGDKRHVPPLHKFSQTFARFWSHFFSFVVWRVLHVSDYRSRGSNARVLVNFFLGLRYNNGFCSLRFFFFKLELVNFFLKWRGRCNPFLSYSLSKRYLLNWLGDQGNTLQNGMIDWWKVVWG